MKRYHTTECIFDLIAACGPQELGELRKECREQCTSEPWLGDKTAQDRADELNNAIHELEHAGIIYRDWGVFEFTEFGYELAENWGKTHGLAK